MILSGRQLHSLLFSVRVRFHRELRGPQEPRGQGPGMPQQWPGRACGAGREVGGDGGQREWRQRDGAARGKQHPQDRTCLRATCTHSSFPKCCFPPNPLQPVPCLGSPADGHPLGLGLRPLFLPQGPWCVHGMSWSPYLVGAYALRFVWPRGGGFAFPGPHFIGVKPEPWDRQGEGASGEGSGWSWRPVSSPLLITSKTDSGNGAQSLGPNLCLCPSCSPEIGGHVPGC